MYALLTTNLRTKQIFLFVKKLRNTPVSDDRDTSLITDWDLDLLVELRKKGKLFLRKLIPPLPVSDADVSTAGADGVASVVEVEDFFACVVLVC